MDLGKRGKGEQLLPFIRSRGFRFYEGSVIQHDGHLWVSFSQLSDVLYVQQQT